jgi:probable HAF family extracellular repeat protein
LRNYIIICTGILLAAHAARGATTFTPLGDLPGGSFRSIALGISGDGSTVVGSSSSATSGSQSEPFLWTSSTGMVGLGYLGVGSGDGRAESVNPTGDIIVGSATTNSGFLGAFISRPGFGMQQLSLFPSFGTGVSADGTYVIGEVYTGASYVTYRWTQATGMVVLGALPGGGLGTQLATGISSDGQIVVGYASSATGPREAFRWTALTGMVGLGDLGGATDSEAFAISADGQYVVGYGTDALGIQAFRWSAAEGMVGLGRFPGPGGGLNTLATAVSAHGNVIVGTISGTETSPFVWDTVHGMRDLRSVLIAEGLGPQLTGWHLGRAQAISADGLTIAGYGENASGQTEAWVAHLDAIPEPSGTGLLALLGIGVRRCRRKGTAKGSDTKKRSSLISTETYCATIIGRYGVAIPLEVASARPDVASSTSGSAPAVSRTGES